MKLSLLNVDNYKTGSRHESESNLVLQNDVLFISPNRKTFQYQDDENLRIQELIKREQEKNAKLLQELTSYPK